MLKLTWRVKNSSMKSFREFLNETTPDRELAVKDGKAVSKLKPPPGHRLQGKDAVNFSATESERKSRAAEKGAETRRRNSKSIARKRERSLKVRKELGL